MNKDNSMSGLMNSSSLYLPQFSLRTFADKAMSAIQGILHIGHGLADGSQSLLLSRARIVSLRLFTIVFLLNSSMVFADSVGLGLARAPEFSGSNDHQVIPAAAFEFETRWGTLKSDRIGAQFDLAKTRRFDTGPVLRISTGRGDSVSDSLVAQLPEIEATLEAGWFIGSGLQLKRLGIETESIVIGKISAVSDVADGHGGTVVSASLGLVLPISETLRVIPSVSINYGDDNYTQAFYGVSADAAQASGLSEFSASGGIESNQLAVVLIRKLNERWSLTGIAAYSVLQNDAADSSITERGSEKQLFTGLIANYNF